MNQKQGGAAYVGQRIEWLDAVRGMGIVLVVIGHAERGLISAGFPMGSGWHYADFALYTFHMPLFFLLAGLNVRASLPRGRVAFLRNKLWTVAWPYLLWSLIQGGILVFFARFTNGGAELRELGAILWAPMAQFWFLYVLFAFHILVTATGARAGILVPMALLGLILGTFWPMYSLPQRLFHFLIFFVAGVLLTRPIKALPPLGTWAILACLALFAALVGLPAWLVFPNHDAPLAVPAAIFGIAAALLLARRLTGRALDWAALLGRASMTIFVLHILATAGTRIAMMLLGVPREPLLYLAVCTAVGVGGPLLADAVFARLGIKPLLGLAAPARSRPEPKPEIQRRAGLSNP
ncbi:MAG: acyltransferase [Rhizorhabdus sp.]